MVKKTREDPKNLKDFLDGLIIEKLKNKPFNKESKAKWLRDAVKKTEELPLATHVAKFTHSSASGATSVYFVPSDAEERPLVGTHCVQNQTVDLHVNNSADLGFGRFFTAKFQGKSIIELAEENSAELASALSDNEEEAYSIMKQLLKIKGQSKPSSHVYMKQIYFPLECGGYHLLSPLFPTTLFHEVHKIINANKKAKYENAEHLDFIKTLTTSYGGSQPPNVSYLNYTRNGKQMLLTSCPPIWKSQKVRPVNDVSVFDCRFPKRHYVTELLDSLEPLIKHPYKNANIKYSINSIIEELADELYNFYAEMQQLIPGWSNDRICRLDEYEKSWLDPSTNENEDDWCTEVASSFANWLSTEIKKYGHTKKMPEESEQKWLKSKAEAVLKKICTEIEHE